jgi:hypothetical protein
MELNRFLFQRTAFFALIYLFFINSTYGSDRYFLCGPDEDGCYPRIYQYCVCIPYNDFEANKYYCLNFDKLTCIPLSQSPNCPAPLIFKNQGECLATIFQSEAVHPCQITTRAFCLEHHNLFCAPDGQPKTCK